MSEQIPPIPARISCMDLHESDSDDEDLEEGSGNEEYAEPPRLTLKLRDLDSLNAVRSSVVSAYRLERAAVRATAGQLLVLPRTDHTDLELLHQLHSQLESVVNLKHAARDLGCHVKVARETLFAVSEVILIKKVNATEEVHMVTNACFELLLELANNDNDRNVLEQFQRESVGRLFELELTNQRLQIKNKLAEANATLARAEELVFWVAHVILGKDLFDEDNAFGNTAIALAGDTEARISRLQRALSRMEQPLSVVNHQYYASNPELDRGCHEMQDSA